MKRALLRKALQWAGITGLRWKLLQPGLYCFNYHRIGDRTQTDFDPGVFSCTENSFQDHLDTLKGRFDLLTVDELLERLTRRMEPVRPWGLITFDDGYIDNYTKAYSLLRSNKIGATFFIVTSFVGGRVLPWWDEIAWAVRRATVDNIRLDGSDDVLLVGQGAASNDLSKVLRVVKRRKRAMAEQKSEVFDKCKPASMPLPSESPFMGWEQIKTMLAEGMSIGSHTHTHPILAALNPAEQRQELLVSKNILEAQLRCEIKSIAYPVGGESAYSDETQRIAQDIGYKIAFSFRGHMNPFPLRASYEVGRFAVDDDMNGSALRSAIVFPSIQ